MVNVVLAAAVVPSQDPLTLLAAVVLYGLYEGTVQVSCWIRPRGAYRPTTDHPPR